ncbi:MAG: GNAT family N-acetyltransferase [Synergistaceae bacterium]|nr:GNAT family N-acetyltransferase [Synergistaceae bacterium]
MSNIVWEDLRFFLEHLRDLPVSESLPLGTSGGFCVSTGNEFENWIYYPEPINDPDTVEMAAKFFRERGMSFMWPVYDGGQELLERSGLLYAGSLEAMTLDPSRITLSTSGHDVEIFQVKTREDARLWARTAWLGFEYGGDVPAPEYCSLVEAFMNDSEAFSLCIARSGGVDAGTFMVTHEPGLMGVYYVCVVPEMRRKGIARAMMSEICRLSEGRTITLQATPSGVPFYEAFGFDDLFPIPVYSTEADIF